MADNNTTPTVNIHEMLALADIARELIRQAKAVVESEEAPETPISEQSAVYIQKLAQRLKVWK